MDTTVAFLLFISSVLAVSPIFGGVVTLQGNQFSIIVGTITLALYFIKDRFSVKFCLAEIISIIIVIFLAIVNSLYWQAATTSFCIYFLVALLLAYKCTDASLRTYVNLLSRTHIILLSGAAAGFFYALAGGEAQFFIKNPDGRENGYYLSTFSNTHFSNFIRPSGFYDEPGALSFFTCLTVALREHLRMPRNLSVWLLLLGLITGSLAHLFFCILYLFVFFDKSNKAKLITSYLSFASILFIILVFIFSNEANKLLYFYIDRFSSDQGGLSANSRSLLIVNAWNYLNPNTFFWGLDGNCIVRNAICNQDRYLKYGENPFSMLVHYGVFLAFPYYLLTITLLISSIRNRNIIMLGVFFLLLQRPYVMTFGYSIIFMLYFHAVMTRKKCFTYD